MNSQTEKVILAQSIYILAICLPPLSSNTKELLTSINRNKSIYVIEEVKI